MKTAIFIVVAGAAPLLACNREAGQQPPANTAGQATAATSPSAAQIVPATDAADAARPPPLSEPTGPIDPKSVDAAGQVVQHYGALIEQGRWRESWRLWSNADAAQAFDRNWRDDAEVHMEIGKPGDGEGAAGSIYTAVPTAFYGKTKEGGSFRRPATVTLRRVNDVPGSTEAQRRWHIERIEFAAKS